MADEERTENEELDYAFAWEPDGRFVLRLTWVVPGQPIGHVSVKLSPEQAVTFFEAGVAALSQSPPESPQ